MAASYRLWLLCLVAVTLLTFSAAQNHGLQTCQGQCVTDMVQQANELGCSSGDILCLCNSKGFLPGVYDCSNKACPAGTDNSSLISYESNVCAAATSASLASASSSTQAFSVTLIPSLSTSGTPASSIPLTTASLAGGATVTIYTAAPPAQTSSAITTSSNNNNSLSTAAKAGIGIGVSLGALIIVGLFAFFCFRQRRRKPMRVDSFHARSRPEYTRDEIHGNGVAASFGSDGDGAVLFPAMAQPAHVYTVPPLPEKSRARAFSGESMGGAGMGRYPSQRYSWSTDPRSEGNGFGKEGVNGLGMSPVSPGGVGGGNGDGGAMSEVSRSPTIGGPEYRNLREGRRPSFTTD